MTGIPDNHALIAAWLAARSIGRGLPLPVADRGGLRVDTNLPNETRRWVFVTVCDGLRAIGREVSLSQHFVKLCGAADELMAELPPTWVLQPQGHFMIAQAAKPAPRPLPKGYRLQSDREGATTVVRILGEDDALAASGYAVEAMGVFIYDRIVTAPEHQRKGLGNIVMHALKGHRASTAAPELLVATEEGRALYETLGWSVLSPFSTAAIPANLR